MLESRLCTGNFADDSDFYSQTRNKEDVRATKTAKHTCGRVCRATFSIPPLTSRSS
jgi:hypothetical protein